MCQFPQLECILTFENFAWQNYWGARAPCAPPPPVPTPM